MAKALVMLLVVSSGAAHAQRPPLRGPDPEVGPEEKVDLPALPAFELPVPEPGFESVKALRVAGRSKLDTDIVVKGYVIWIYDCIDAIRRPRESKAQAQRRIDADPTLCERKKLYLGQTRHDAAERGLWVVDVPRAPNKLERERLPKEEIDNWPAVPTVKFGDYVAISDRYALVSSHAERNSDGLLVGRAGRASAVASRVLLRSRRGVRTTLTCSHAAGTSSCGTVATTWPSAGPRGSRSAAGSPAPSATSWATSATCRHHPRQEPDAVVSPVRICAGALGNGHPYLDQSSTPCRL
jgi:hypothetical protein